MVLEKRIAYMAQSECVFINYTYLDYIKAYNKCFKNSPISKQMRENG